jgi:hypothetical protein
MSAGEEKAARTNHASKQIMDAETVSREKKTARLRALRLEKEAAEAAAEAANPVVAKPVRKKAAKKVS